MIEVKGTAIASVSLFVKSKFPDSYENWIDSLPEESRDIMKKCLVSSWYPRDDALLVPTQKICEMFYQGKEEGAWECGRFSSDNALKGVYKFFVKLGSPEFIIKRAGMIFSAYYKPAKMQVVESQRSKVVVQISDFAPSHRLLEVRMMGWMERSLEISGCKHINIKITKSPTKGDPVVEYVIGWE